MNDKTVLDSCNALHNMGDDREIYHEVLETYVDTIPDQFEAMTEAGRANDRVALRRCAHTLKSSSLTIGGLKIGANALHLEKNAETMDEAAILLHIAAMKQQYKELLDALKKEGFITDS